MDAGNILSTSLAVLIMGGFMSIAHGQVFSFDSDTPGAPPPGWRQGVTGAGAANWAVAADDAAPSPRNVLLQTGVGAFPWIVRTDVALLDGYVEVRFKAINGAEDQAGGVLWRWQDGANYYVARATGFGDFSCGPVQAPGK